MQNEPETQEKRQFYNIFCEQRHKQFVTHCSLCKKRAKKAAEPQMNLNQNSSKMQTEVSQPAA